MTWTSDRVCSFGELVVETEMSNPRSRCPHVATIGSITEEDFVQATQVSCIEAMITDEKMFLAHSRKRNVANAIAVVLICGCV